MSCGGTNRLRRGLDRGPRSSPRREQLGSGNLRERAVLHVVGVERERERGRELALGAVEVAASKQHPGSHDVDAERSHALRIEGERGPRGVVDVVPVAELERDHRRVREQIAAVRAVEAEPACERRRPRARRCSAFVEPSGLRAASPTG